MLIGESVQEMARKMARKEVAHKEELEHWRRLTILVGLGAFVLGVLLGVAL